MTKEKVHNNIIAVKHPIFLLDSYEVGTRTVDRCSMIIDFTSCIVYTSEVVTNSSN